MNNKILLIWFSTLLICFGVTFWLILPQINHLIENSNLQKQNTLNQTANNNLDTNINQLAKDFDLPNLLEIANTYIPQTDQSANLKTVLSGMANQAGLTVTNFQNQTQPTDLNVNTNGFTINLTGKTFQLISFLKLIESSTQLFSLKNIEIKPSGQTMTTKISGQTYWSNTSNQNLEELNNNENLIETFTKFQSLIKK
ncbi:MAG: type 4a pilus biogenesis protein PilO [Candidatus Berkelbacteria bacterium]